MNKRRITGVYAPSTVAGETVKAFLPHPLPPQPPLQLNDADYDLLERANRALGRLDGLATMLPNPALLIYLYVRQEAVLSSQIEGTQSSLADLLLYESNEAPGVPLDDVAEVSRYVAALQHGLARLRSGFPLSLRLLREVHEILLASGRGSGKAPGNFRRSQNWIGGTRPGNAYFVPPPPEQVPECLSALEKFLHDQPTRTPLLLKAALAHVQFETIHPFLDGNGRIGRLLVTLLLCAEGALHEPILYLSLYFKEHRSLYYEHLQRVRVAGDWESWLRFFLEGVLVTSEQALATAQAILRRFAEDRRQIEGMGRAAASALRVHEVLQTKPLLTIATAAQATGLSVPTVTAALLALERQGIVQEMTERQRGRLFRYRQYLALLQPEAQPEIQPASRSTRKAR